MTDTFVDAGKFAMCSPALDSYMPEICAMTIMTLSADKQALFQNKTAMEEVANESMFKMIDEMKGMLPMVILLRFYLSYDRNSVGKTDTNSTP